VDFQRRQIEVRASLSNQDFHDAVHRRIRRLH
jgi:hypothetical protein